MGAYCPASAGQSRRSGPIGGGQPPILEGVLWLARVGAPLARSAGSLRELNSVFQRFRRWALKGVFERMFKVLSGDPDFEYGPDRRQAIGRSRGGLTTKIVALVDAWQLGAPRSPAGPTPLQHRRRTFARWRRNRRVDWRQGLRHPTGFVANSTNAARSP